MADQLDKEAKKKESLEMFHGPIFAIDLVVAYHVHLCTSMNPVWRKSAGFDW